MTPPLESIICGTQEDATAFGLDCQAIFSTPAGGRVLARLCAAAHPMLHAPGMTDHERGRHEVVATLWRYGSRELLPPSPETTTP